MNACFPLLAFTLAAQKALLGAWGYAVMAGFSGTLKIVMSMLPDEEKDQKMLTCSP
jgi:hypothetical protein